MRAFSTILVATTLALSGKQGLLENFLEHF